MRIVLIQRGLRPTLVGATAARARAVVVCAGVGAVFLLEEFFLNGYFVGV